MTKSRKLLSTIPLLLLLSCSHTERAITFPKYIPEDYRHDLKTWLSSHPSYRLALETDCISCAGSIERMRKQNYGDWKPLPHYQPYYTVGDFNSDSIDDFAVVVV